MITHLRRSVVVALFCLVFFGLLYPLAGTGVSQVLFKHQADGSITANGSTLMARTGPARSSSTGAPTTRAVRRRRGQPTRRERQERRHRRNQPRSPSKVLLADTKALIAYWHKMGVNPTEDLVTTSGSGIDPDITPARVRRGPDGVQGHGTVSEGAGQTHCP